MWAVLGRALAAVGLIVAAVGFATFIAAASGVWWLKAGVNQRTDELAAKANAAVDAADHAVVFVREVIDQADRDLKSARTQPAAESQQPVNPFVQFSARRFSGDLAGSVERASTAVTTASDAVEIAQTAVRLFGEDEELKSWLGVKPEQLVQTRTGLGGAARELKRVRTVLGIPLYQADGSLPTDEQLMTVESALNQARAFTGEMSDAVLKTRAKVNDTKRAVDLWVLRTAVGVTAVGVLGAVGQFFMARFCWRVLRRLPA